MQHVYELIVPETVEAVRVTTETEAWIAGWCKGVLIEDVHPLTRAKRVLGVWVPTLNGLKEGTYGTYVLKKRHGDFCVVDAAKFESKYRLVR